MDVSAIHLNPWGVVTTTRWLLTLSVITIVAPLPASADYFCLDTRCFTGYACGEPYWTFCLESEPTCQPYFVAQVQNDALDNRLEKIDLSVDACIFLFAWGGGRLGVSTDFEVIDFIPNPNVVYTGTPIEPHFQFHWPSTTRHLGQFVIVGNPDGPPQHTVTTIPPGLPVFVDVGTVTSPGYFAWETGSEHVVSARAHYEPMEGSRFLFESWSDGGDLTRLVEATDPPSTFAASYSHEFLVTVDVDGGNGTVVPGTGWYPAREPLVLTALPDSGYQFVGWEGEGLGSSNSSLERTVIEMIGPVKQTARFVPATIQAVVDSEPTDLSVRVDRLVYTTPAVFAWPPFTKHRVSIDSLQAGSPGTRFRYVRWNNGGLRDQRFSVGLTPISLKAELATDHKLTFEASSSGTMSPGDGWYGVGEQVVIEAYPASDHVFDDWVGTGSGSYTGPQNPVAVKMNGPVHQTPRFHRVSHELSLSLSGVDPFESVGPPPGVGGQVHLWLVCSTAGGATYFEADLLGDIPILAFVPSSGIVNAGDATHLKLFASECLSGPTRLGTFFVSDVAGGEVCFAPSSDNERLAVSNCLPTITSFEWPVDVHVTGLKTRGTGLPCGSGRRCDSTDEPTPVLLSGLSADYDGGAVVVTWATSFEYWHDGFHIYRAENRRGSFVRLTRELVRGSSPYRFVDASVETDRTYFYEVGAVDLEGFEQRFGPVSVTMPPETPLVDMLGAARPNPFRNETELALQLSRPDEIVVSIYDVGGRVVRRIFTDELPAGSHRVVWDGHDDKARRVRAGVYFVRVDGNTWHDTRKLVLLE